MAASIEQELGLPVLEGKKPQDMAQLFTKALSTRSTKTAEIVGKLNTIPVAERSENIKKP